MIRHPAAIGLLILLLLGATVAAGGAAPGAAGATPGNTLAAPASADSAGGLPATPDDPPLRIGTITIRVLDVFSPGEAAGGWLYRTANTLHIDTRESVIRKLLLFREGQSYDPERLAESERNLRGLDFVKAASVTAGAPRDGVVDVEVVTQDAWTTELNANASRRGGRTTWAAGLRERDVLGTGRELDLSYDDNVERVARRIWYHDPCLLGAYWNGDFLYSDNSDGREVYAGLARPFVSAVSRWSAGLLADDSRWRKHLYAGGTSRAEIEQRHREVEVRYGRALDPGRGRPVRLTVGLLAREDRFEAVGDSSIAFVPDLRNHRYVFVEGEILRSRFLKLNYINRDARYEDFELGPRVALRLGISPEWFGPERTTGMARLQASRGLPLGKRGFVLGRASFETRLDGGPSNTVLAGELRSAWRLPTRLKDTAVARLHYVQGWSLDRDVQFFADGSTGLRGYRLYAFEGDRCLILNLENRIFGARELARLVTPGAAFFVDGGLATPPGRRLAMTDLKGDAGIGLRLGIPRAPGHVVFRVDCAWPFSPDPLGRRGPLVSFSGSQAF